MLAGRVVGFSDEKLPVVAEARCKLVALEHDGKGFGGDVDFAEAFHAGFAFFLLVEEFRFAVAVAGVDFNGDVFAIGADSFAGNDFSANSSLESDFKVLARNNFF